MFTHAGKRDRYVTIQQRSTTDAVDIAGAPTETWTTLTNAWAQKVEVEGRHPRERFESNQLTAPRDTVWRLGYRSDIDPELVNVEKLRRVVYQSRVYDIVQARMMGRREGVELLTLSGGTLA